MLRCYSKHNAMRQYFARMMFNDLIFDCSFTTVDLAQAPGG